MKKVQMVSKKIEKSSQYYAKQKVVKLLVTLAIPTSYPQFNDFFTYLFMPSEGIEPPF
ncbi:hypothetical protein [Listeria booriae]|uniref:hypothetical protein n=1 Tax=Listeria booriae TaxID=1552123 RepID=UPI001C89EB1A|nr:hypothetical protein [Listeria booriae]